MSINLDLLYVQIDGIMVITEGANPAEIKRNED